MIIYFLFFLGRLFVLRLSNIFSENKHNVSEKLKTIIILHLYAYYK